MVYFDNAATTNPKPPIVNKTLAKAAVTFGANPGRSGHKLSSDTAYAVFSARAKCADFFGCGAENTIFTLNCTHALNYAIKGIFKQGAHVVISDLEHNAVYRSVHAAAKSFGGSYSIATISRNPAETILNFEKAVTSKTIAVITTAASNLTGQILPFREIAALCKRTGICYILDAAQAAGFLPISLSDGVNIICSAGHKGLYGPMGTGLMLTDGQFPLNTIIEGGTGSNSTDVEQPIFLPDRFESGTLNTSGAISLGAGVDFVSEKTPEKIFLHEKELCNIFIEESKKNSKTILYFGDTNGRVPIVPFNIKGINSADAANILSEKGFYMRGGYHCAPLAHKKLKTLDIGAIRFSPGIYNTKSQVLALLKAINDVF